MRKLPGRSIVVLGVWFLFILSVSFPIIYTGFNLSVIYADVTEYEQNQYYSSPKLNDAISQELEFRVELTNHQYPVIALMAASRWYVWFPLFIFVGIFPVYAFVQIMYELFNRFRN